MPDWKLTVNSGHGMDPVPGGLIFPGLPVPDRDEVGMPVVAVVNTPFGRCLTASAGDALCFLEFIDDDGQAAMGRLEILWPGVRFVSATTPGRPLGPLLSAAGRDPVGLHLRGTLFQLRVWSALLAVPAGTRIAYSELAARIGRPSAVRAVAGAVAANHLAVLVPCHRVVRADGNAGGYRWGAWRKLALLAAEQAAVRPNVTDNAVIPVPGG